MTNRDLLFAAFLSIFSASCSKQQPQADVTPPVPVIFEDSFTDTDGANLGSSWVVTLAGGATLSVSSNRAYPVQGGAASPTAIYDSQLGDIGYLTSVDLVVSGGTYSGDAFIVAKATATGTPANGYLCGIDKTSGKVALFRMVAGTPTQLAASPAIVTPLAAGTTATLTLDVVTFLTISLTCTLTLNGVEHTAASTDTAYPNAGYWGLFGGDSAGNTLYFDNFRITN